MGDALSGALEGLGVRVQPQWLSACAGHLQAASTGYNRSSVQQQAKMVLQQLLQCDLNACGAPALPPGVQARHDTVLAGKLMLQVDEVLNIGAAVRERYSGNDGAGRCLKLLLTDGVQQVAAMEYHPTPALHSAMPAGTKLVVQDAAVRRGILLLTPQCCGVLGGQVERLEGARQRMVAHLTQPAVGRRGPPRTMQQALAEASQVAWAESAPPLPSAPLRSQQQAAMVPAGNLQQPAPGRALQPSQQAVQQQGGAPTRLPDSRPQPAAVAAGAASRAFAVQAPQEQQQQRSVPAVYMQRPNGGIAQQQPQQAPPPSQQQQQQAPPQRLHVGRGSAGHVLDAQTAAAAPLQELNRNAAASGGAKRSRLALRKPPSQEDVQRPPAADCTFAAPPQQQRLGQAPPPRLQACAPPQLIDRLRRAVAGGPAQPQAGADLAAGTADDPIYLSDDEQQARTGGAGGPDAADEEMVEAAEDPGSGALSDDWGEELPAGPQLDPWEQGFDADEQLEAAGAGNVDEEQLPDAEEGWRSADAEPFQPEDEAGGWQQDCEEDEAAGGQAGGSEGSWADEDGEDELQEQPAAAAPLATHPARAPPSGRHCGGDSEAKQPRPAATGTFSEGTSAAQQRQVEPAPLAGAACQLEAPDPSLLAAPPSLTEVLYPRQSTPPSAAQGKPAAAAAAGGEQAAAAAGRAGPASRSAAKAVATPVSGGRAGQPAGSGRRAVLNVPALQQPAHERRPAPPSVEESDNDAPSFDILPAFAPVPQQGGAAAHASDEPFIYLLQLRPKDFPILATIYGTVVGVIGTMQFRDAQGQPQYGMRMQVEDGSMVATADLSTQFMQDFLELGAQQLEAALADAATAPEARQRTAQLQTLLASYSGLMSVRLASPDGQLEVLDLGCELSVEQAAALQRRATAAM